jgi:hypothetical protein
MLIVVFLIIGMYPGVGGEGAQRNIPIYNDKYDNSGFLLPLIYGYWPNLFGSWLFTLGLLQICLYSIGMKFIFDNLGNKFLRLTFIFPYLIGVFFVLQVVRDATSFSLFVLGLGLIVKGTKLQKKMNTFFNSLSFFCIILGCFFKPILAPIVALTYLIFISTFYPKKISFFVKIFLMLLISITPYAADKYLTSKLDLRPGYAEQQLFLYDAAKMYCWGHQSVSKDLAKQALSPFIHKNSNYESICASLEPMAWDHLRVELSDVINSPALTTYTGNDESIIRNLVKNWVSLILSNPFEWIQLKVIDSAQVLVMANSFYIEPLLQKDQSNIFLTIGDQVIELLFVPVRVLDKLRTFSIGASFLLAIIILLSNGRIFRFRNFIDLIVVKFLSIVLLTWMMLTFLYISNPGRYIFPYVFLSYIYMYSAINENINKNFKPKLPDFWRNRIKQSFYVDNFKE